MQSIIQTEKPARAPWGDTRPVAIIANERTTKGSKHYDAAKGGDQIAALDLAYELLDNDKAQRKLRSLLRDHDPLVVPVHAMEGQGVNMIPIAMAEHIAAEHDLRTALDIIQINQVGHTGSSGYHRLATPALFAGDVVAGGNYLIVDDFVGQGGTLANIRGHIQLNGGNVIGMVAMAGQRRSATIAVKADTLKALREKHEALESWWNDIFGYSYELLTESEAKYLIRSPDADTIRENIAAAAR